MTRREKISVVCLLLVCSFCAGFARESLYLGSYKYNDWKEFYAYMNKAADFYNRVGIQICDNYGDSDELTSFQGSFGDTVFNYNVGEKTLSAFFLNSQLRKQTDYGIRWFDLPSEYSQAVKYWNELLDYM